MRAGNKRIAAVIGCIAVIGIAAAGFAMVRLRGSVKVVPSEDFAGPEVVYYRQDDSRWAADPLGTSEFTMKSSGCLVSCVAAAMQMADNRADRPDPGVLNLELSEQQVYDSAGNMQWGKLDELDGFQVDVYRDASAAVLEECLQQGQYPIVRVRMRGYGSFHYVLITGARAGRFYCMDPLSREPEPVPLSQFGNRIYAIRCVYPESE